MNMRMSDLTQPLIESQGKFYHATPARQWGKIKREGLQPKIGLLSKRLGEKLPRIYLFSSLEELENGLGNWFGEERAGDLAILEITPPPGIQFHSPETPWEVVTTQPIPPEYIRLVRFERD